MGLAGCLAGGLAGCSETIEQPAEEVVEYQQVRFAVGVANTEMTKGISGSEAAANGATGGASGATGATGESAQRELSDGSLAVNLDFAVYHNGEWIESVAPAVGDTPAKNAVVTGGNGNWVVTLTLAKNVEYDIVFWAHANDAPYSFNKAEHQIVVDYSGAANDEKRDAFYACCEGYTVTDSAIDVDLTRPFAQINIGARDYDPYITDFGFAMTSSIKCKAPSVLDVLDGSVSNEVDVEFDLESIPYEMGYEVLTETGGVTYHWMSMNYILAAKSNDNLYGDFIATFNYNNLDLPVKITSVPYRRNFKTNILGTIFTGPATFNVVVVPGYAGSDIEHPAGI